MKVQRKRQWKKKYWIQKGRIKDLEIVGGKMIRYGIIGCGEISGIHADSIAKIEEASLVACCDIDEGKGLLFAKNNHCALYNDYEKLIDSSDIDAVIIATPHFLHADMTIRALNAGKNVLCEKPMAITLEDIKRVKNACQKTDTLYAVCFQNRFNASFVKLKEMMKTSSFGPLRGIKGELTWDRDQSYYDLARWKGTWSKEGGGVLMNQAIHTLDAITWLVSPVKKVSGRIMTSLLEGRIEVEDNAMVTAIVGDIPVIFFASNSYSQSPPPKLTFDFDNAIVELTMEQLSVNGQSIDTELIVKNDIRKEQWGNGHLRLLRAFTNQLESVDDDLIPYLPQATDADEAVKFVLGVYQSDKEKKWITLQ